MVMQTELKKLGLKDKEAAVYLACLELGSSPVQRISRKAKVVRATTYVVLTSLAQKGLVTQFKEGKKTLFSAEPPRQLMRLLEKEQERLEDQKKQLENFLPELQVLLKTMGGQPSVRYFEGKEGLLAIRHEIVMQSHAGDVVYNLTPSDHLMAIFPDDESSYFRQRVAKGVGSKTIFTTRSEKLRQDLLAHAHTKNSELRFIPHDQFPASSGMTIYGDRVAIVTFSGQLMGVVIDSQQVAEMMRGIFSMLWRSLEIVAE